MAIKLHPSVVVHPGQWLAAEIVGPSGHSVTLVADHLGVSRVALSTLLNGHANLSPEMAIRFEKLFGVSADTLNRMQAAFGLAQARLNEGSIKVRELEAA